MPGQLDLAPDRDSGSGCLQEQRSGWAPPWRGHHEVDALGQHLRALGPEPEVRTEDPEDVGVTADLGGGAFVDHDDPRAELQQRICRRETADTEASDANRAGGPVDRSGHC